MRAGVGEAQVEHAPAPKFFGEIAESDDAAHCEIAVGDRPLVRIVDRQQALQQGRAPMQDDIRPRGDHALDGRLQPAPVEHVERDLHQPDVGVLEEHRQLVRPIDRRADATDLSLPLELQQRLPDRALRLFVVLEAVQEHGIQAGPLQQPQGPVDRDVDALLRFVRRQVGSLSVNDLLVLVLIADAAQNAMAGEYKSVPDGIVLVGTIIF